LTVNSFFTSYVLQNDTEVSSGYLNKVCHNIMIFLIHA